MDLTPKSSMPWWSLFGCCRPSASTALPASTPASVPAKDYACFSSSNSDDVATTTATATPTTTSSTEKTWVEADNDELEDRLGSVVKVLVEIEQHTAESGHIATVCSTSGAELNDTENAVPTSQAGPTTKQTEADLLEPKQSKVDDLSMIEHSNERDTSLSDAEKMATTQTDMQQVVTLDSKPRSSDNVKLEQTAPTQDDIQQRLKEANAELKEVREKRNKARTRKQRNTLIKKEDALSKETKSLKAALEKFDATEKQGKAAQKQRKNDQIITPRKATSSKKITPISQKSSVKKSLTHRTK